jgi:hypothetical protein
MKVTAFRCVMPFGLGDRYQVIGGTCCSHPEGTLHVQDVPRVQEEGWKTKANRDIRMLMTSLLISSVGLHVFMFRYRPVEPQACQQTALQAPHCSIYWKPLT